MDTKRNSYTVQLCSGQYGEVDCYVTDGNNHLALFMPLSPAPHSCVPNANSQLKAIVDSILIPVQPDNVLLAVPVENIVGKVVSIKATTNLYIAHLPNRIEKE